MFFQERSLGADWFVSVQDACQQTPDPRTPLLTVTDDDALTWE